MKDVKKVRRRRTEKGLSPRQIEAIKMRVRKAMRSASRSQLRDSVARPRSQTPITSDQCDKMIPPADKSQCAAAPNQLRWTGKIVMDWPEGFRQYLNK